VSFSIAILPGCGDDNGIAPEPLTIADFAGTWNCTAYTAVGSDNPQLQFDLLAVGGSLTATVQSNGSFTGEVTFPDPATSEPQTIPIQGSFSLISQTLVRIEFNPEIPPILTTDTFEFTLSGNTLTLHDDASPFDFDFDGQNEVAIFDATLVRS
jgi:hypothetical protein